MRKKDSRTREQLKARVFVEVNEDANAKILGKDATVHFERTCGIRIRPLEKTRELREGKWKRKMHWMCSAQKSSLTLISVSIVEKSEDSPPTYDRVF